MSVQDKTAGKRRGQALTGALAGVAVIAVLVAVFIGIQVSDDDKPTNTSAPAAAASEPAQAQPSAPAAEPSAPAAQTPLDPALKEKPVVKAGKGKVTKLVVKELIAGKGPKLTAGQTIQANYVGVTYKDGKQFDSSWDRGQLAEFPIGVGRLIEGWDKGLVGVPVGSRVQLDIPEALAYPNGNGPAGDLRFVVDVLAAQ
ncbi:FKBP-type peptidyl-prolyl cis-trans isomerase [Couchioplanes caeruleus]|uniref:FKBP-type peptidyl-prolyl cis-trans isomerase n=1 Tax=Couchioplanes caeruleus TaxID=56438 RepID=UPI00201BD251|nr:FKBP-type peptidyl-prolyl cis-trans isomerase [Couchioplanes caeruleus]UQU61423.1 FKBP-type peptidyl-prolyl cis-trans isomerase [Couchioplanes caeruleus]